MVSPAQLRDKQLELSFRSYGLQHLILQVDPKTTIACWCKPSDLDPNFAEPTAKPAVVFLHAFATSGLWQWHHQVKPLQKSFRVFVPDLIFFGKSTTQSSNRSEIFQAQMIAKAMESLKVPSYSVVGTSYGGFVAFRLAHLFPERVEKVIIANSGLCMTPKDSEELLGRAKVEKLADLFLPHLPEAFRTLMSLSMYNPPMFLPSFVLQSIIEYFYSKNRDAQEELVEGVTLGAHRVEPLPSLKQKVLLIWGEHDSISPPRQAHELKKHLGDNAELVFVEGAAHCTHLDNPKEFNLLVEKFLLK